MFYAFKSLPFRQHLLLLQTFLSLRFKRSRVHDPLRAPVVPKSPRWATRSVSRSSTELGERRVYLST
jgi:hypothetical protein